MVLVVIEGLDGSGKSTLVRNLKSLLENEKMNFVLTSEPTDGPVGKILKDYLVKSERNLVLEALMFASDRFWHVIHVIDPPLKQGKIIISDRYKYSSIAYQVSQDSPRDWVETINRFAPEADLAVFLNVNPDSCIERLRDIGKRFSVMEERENLWRVYENYLEMVREGRLVDIDGNLGKWELADNVFKIILERAKST